MITIESILREEEERKMIQSLVNRVESESAKDAIRAADELADMILFHARVRKNAEMMNLPWEM